MPSATERPADPSARTIHLVESVPESTPNNAELLALVRAHEARFAAVERSLFALDAGLTSVEELFKAEMRKVRGLSARISENVSRMRSLREQVEHTFSEVRALIHRGHNG